MTELHLRQVMATARRDNVKLSMSEAMRMTRLPNNDADDAVYAGPTSTCRQLLVTIHVDDNSVTHVNFTEAK